MFGVRRSTDKIGPRGERLAAKFLKRLGYRILRRNWNSKFGEIDLIARDGDEVVFVEVKTRASRAWGDPEEAVTPAKRRKLSRTAVEFVERHRLREYPLRFDIVAIVLPKDGDPEFEHFKDAFTISKSVGG